MIDVVLGILIPFLGTTLGAGCVLFMKNGFGRGTWKALSGFAGGVMIAASVWSLLIPSINMTEEAGESQWGFVPAAVGFLAGIFFLLMLDKVMPHIPINCESAESQVGLRRSAMLVLAVTLHNIPEGMVVGAAFAGMLADNEMITKMEAFTLAVGIAIQNFPEGAIIAMPMRAAGTRKNKAFTYGSLSGVVEPLGALLTVALSRYLIPILPYLLSFAAGAMVYVVVDELIPESTQGKKGCFGTIGFALGFVLMMTLDVALG